MKIVIIGDGKVGYKLAKQLSEENYDVILIDKNPIKLKEATDKLDISCIIGDGASVEVQKEADVPDADLVIACTSMDELNMLICLIARKIGAKHTIARVRNPIYFQQMDILKDELRLSMAVNPELAVAREIERILIFPVASKIETFVKGRMELVEYSIKDGNPVIGMSLLQIYKKYRIKILVCAVKRNGEVIIPTGDFVLEKGDRLHIAAAHAKMEAFFKSIGNYERKINKVIICGGGRVGYYLSKQLCQLGMQVKIIEKDYQQCEKLCEMLPKATIIHGDATDHDLIDKIVAKVNEDMRVQMVENLGIDSTVSTKDVTADAITSYVRARHNSIKSANVETMYLLVDGKVEALEFLIHKETEYTNIPIKNLSIKQNILIACIGRKGKIIIPSGDDSIHIGDSVVVITKERRIQDIAEIFI
ncbi:Trk system potassium transporter TrkA [Clostridium sp. Marseille-P299]|uniref:Trk system potassium transporter TrkA n=1 Tax=Clostridium sp. Marseille-P299 TaxID=1805477 RepID=UPI0008320061|nr:Trk system potassium transporter TrkA [Clostridium sp. Marseille-P299]